MDWMRKYVFANLPLKIVALLTAVWLWAVVAREPIAEVGLTVHIEFHNVPDNLEIASEDLPEAHVRLRGPGRLLRSVQADDVHAAIDLSGAVPGERTYDLLPSSVRVPAGITAVNVVPTQFRLTFDTRATRQLEVHPRVTGSFASGYRITHITADPASITVVGPAQRVNGLRAALTDPIDATGVVGQATFTTNPYVPDPLVRIVHPGTIHVTIQTEKDSSAVLAPRHQLP
jgi:YbbR domain-containing protein